MGLRGAKTLAQAPRSLTVGECAQAMNMAQKTHGAQHSDFCLRSLVPWPGHDEQGSWSDIIPSCSRGTLRGICMQAQELGNPDANVWAMTRFCPSKGPVLSSSCLTLGTLETQDCMWELAEPPCSYPSCSLWPGPWGFSTKDGQMMSQGPAL